MLFCKTFTDGVRERKVEAVTCWIFVEEEDLLDVAGELRHDLVEGGGQLLPAAVPPVEQNCETRYLDNRHLYTSDIYTSTILHVWYRTIILDFAELRSRWSPSPPFYSGPRSPWLQLAPIHQLSNVPLHCCRLEADWRLTRAT